MVTFNRIGNNGFGGQFRNEQNENWDTLEKSINDLNAPGSITTEKIADHSVTVEKLKDVDYQRNTLSAGVIGSNRVWEKTALFPIISGMTEEFGDNTELTYGKKLLTLTVTNTTNYKHLINPEKAEQANLGVAVPTYYKRYKKISMALNYKISKASGSRPITVAIFVKYSDGTNKILSNELKAAGGEYAEIFEQSFDTSKNISNVYLYVQGGDFGDVIKISYASYWFGKTNDNPFDQDALQSRIDENSEVIVNKVSRVNWFLESKNIVGNKPVNNANVQISNDFKINGVKALSKFNNQRTPFWLEMECTSSNATPFIQIPVHDLMKRLKALKGTGFTLPKINVRLEINFAYDTAHQMTFQLLSKKVSDNTFYSFPPTIYNKPGRETTIIEFSNDVDSVINSLQDWLAVYVTFKTNINTNKIYLGWCDVWFDDDKHILQEEYIEGKSIKSGTLTEAAADPVLLSKLNRPAIEPYNWCSYVPDFVNKGIAPSSSYVTPGADFNYLGVASLSGIRNARKTEYWIDWTGKTSAAKPFGFLKSKGLFESLVAAETRGQKIQKVNFELEIYMPYDEAHTITVRGIGDGNPSGWFYFPLQTVNKPFGPYLAKISGTIDIGTNSWGAVIKSWIGIYLTFNQIMLDKHAYFGDFSIWVEDDAKHTFVPEFISGSTIAKETITKDKLDADLQDMLSSSPVKNVLSSPKKAAFVGDSVTWGDGHLSDGYIKVIDQLIRENQGQVLPSDSKDVIYTGTNSSVVNKKFYGEKATKIAGENSSVKFTMKSSEVHICQAIERGNGNTTLEVYVNGSLFDTFDNKNLNPSGSETLDFTGDGSTVKFDLGKAFTYGHVVTVAGSVKKGKLNSGGYGGTFPPGDDYMVIRKTITNSEGEDEVHHVLWFNTPPVNGDAINVTQKHGESISYSKTTIGEIGSDFSSGLESTFGDGTTAFDPSNPSSLSSGLDFRSVDRKSFISYKFPDVQEREIVIKVKGLSAGSTGTPYFIFNFASDLRFEYMNAGIGGFTYELFDKDTGLTSYRKFMEYEPDFITILLGANDDWNASSYPATQSKLVDSNTLINNSYHWYSSAVLEGSQYRVADRWVDTVTVKKYSVKLSGEVTVGSISKGDYIIVNKWTNDERYCQVKLIDSYNPSTKTVAFLTPLDLDALPANPKVMVKSLAQYKANALSVINKARAYNAKIPIHIAASGVPNMNHRQLVGYREVIRDLANTEGFSFVDLFEETSIFEATNKRDKSYTIASTGATSYTVDTNINPILRNVRVTVDGKEVRMGKDAFISGGYGYYYNENLTKGYAVRPTVITFATPPAVNAVIKVEGTLTYWSSDYTHMGAESGKFIYGETFYKSIKKHF